jgi:AcrR family transcriptional regulator
MSYPKIIKKENVILKALELLDQGKKLTMSDLAHHLHIKTPSLYRHFHSHQILLEAVLDYGLQQLDRQLKESFNTQKTLDAVAQAFRHFALAHASLYQLMYQPRLNFLIANKIRKIFSEIFDTLFKNNASKKSALLIVFESYLVGFCLLEISNPHPSTEMIRYYAEGLAALENHFKH